MADFPKPTVEELAKHQEFRKSLEDIHTILTANLPQPPKGYHYSVSYDKTGIRPIIVKDFVTIVPEEKAVDGVRKALLNLGWCDTQIEDALNAIHNEGVVFRNAES